MSTHLTTEERGEFTILLTKAFDDELTADERKLFEKYLDDYEKCRLEWQEYTKLKEVTKEMKLKTPEDETWDQYWVSVYNRLERSMAWVLFSIGSIIILTYGGFKAMEALIADPGMEVIMKAGLLLMIGGLATLLVSVIREKLNIRKSDPYKEVRR